MDNFDEPPYYTVQYVNEDGQPLFSDYTPLEFKEVYRDNVVDFKEAQKRLRAPK